MPRLRMIFLNGMMKLRLLIAVLFLSVTAGNVWSKEEGRPNILWIFVEDLSPHFGCYGNSTNAGYTPTIDALAAGGTLFKNAFVPAPVCSASRSAILTGVMQTTTGTHHHRSSRSSEIPVPEDLRINLPDGIRTIPELMRDAGYFTFNTGKDDYNFHYDRTKLYNVGTKPNYTPGENGWSGNSSKEASLLSGKMEQVLDQMPWRSLPDPSQPWFGQIMLWGGKAKDRYVRPGQKLPANSLKAPSYYPDTPVTREVWTTHHNAARGTDRQVQQILDQLKEDGQLEKTIVFFFSDHGSNQSLRHKQFCYEGGVHVPLIIKGPTIPNQLVRDDLVSGLDISASTLGLAGVALPDYLHGRNLFAKGHKARTHVVSARDRCDYTIDRIRTVRTKRFRYIKNYFVDRPLLQPQYRDDWAVSVELKRLHEEGKLTDYQAKHWFGKRPAEELYDMEADPHQLQNLAADKAHQKELERHRKLLDTWIKESNDRGQKDEDLAQLRATYEFWKEKPIFRDAKKNPEYQVFLK